MKNKKVVALALAALVLCTGCGRNGNASKGPEQVISKADSGILEDAVNDIDDVARLCESAKPDIKTIEKRCQDGSAKADKLENKDKQKLMKESYDLLLKYVKNKGKDDAYQNFVKALQAKEQLNQ